MLRLSRRRQTRANGADLSATSCETLCQYVCPKCVQVCECECVKCGVRVRVHGKSEIRTVNGINIETLLPPQPYIHYTVYTMPSRVVRSAVCTTSTFAVRFHFRFAGVIVSSADAPSKRNERLYGRNDGVFVFWILLHSSLQSQSVTASYSQLPVTSWHSAFGI